MGKSAGEKNKKEREGKMMVKERKVKTGELTVGEVKRLEEELRESKSALNNMLTLIEAARGADASGASEAEEVWKVQMSALLALCRCCSRLMETGDLLPPGCVKPKETAKGLNRKEIKESNDTLTVWMASTYKEVVKIALDLVQGERVKGQLVGMRAAMGLVAREAETATEMGCSPHVWTDGLFPALVAAMLTSPHVSQHMLRSFAERYLDVYGDVRYYAWRAVAAFAARRLAKEESEAGLPERAAAMARSCYDLMCLLHLPPAEPRKKKQQQDRTAESSGEGEEQEVLAVSVAHLVPSSATAHTSDVGGAGGAAAGNGGKKRALRGLRVDFSTLGVYRKAFSDAWLAMLRVQLPNDVLKSVLIKLHTDILPHMTQPLLLADVLTTCYERGGMLSVLSLHGIFALIQNHNLEYAPFFTKLYALLDSSVFHARHRARVLKLMEACLKTPLLPAAVIAAFIKRFARLALSSPASGCLVAMCFIYNLLRKHPTCLCLLHRPLSGALPHDSDPYDVAEEEPAKARALESSLWELEALRRHVVPDVSKMAQIFDDAITRQRPELSLAEALEASYRTMSDKHARKKVKGGDERIALTFTAPISLIRSHPVLKGVFSI